MQKMARARGQQASSARPRVVYDLARLHREAPRAATSAPLGNVDVERCGRVLPAIDHLCFESRFESGNLRAAIQTSDTHYELVLSPDINESRSHYQWFYFEVCEHRTATAT